MAWEKQRRQGRCRCALGLIPELFLRALRESSLGCSGNVPREGAQTLEKVGGEGRTKNWAADLEGKGCLKTQLFSS